MDKLPVYYRYHGFTIVKCSYDKYPFRRWYVYYTCFDPEMGIDGYFNTINEAKAYIDKFIKGGSNK